MYSSLASIYISILSNITIFSKIILSMCIKQDKCVLILKSNIF